MASEDDAGLEPCARCGELIDPEVSVCPECENNPGRKAKMAAGLLILIALVLILINPLVGAPLLVVGILGFIMVQGAHYSPTDHDF